MDDPVEVYLSRCLKNWAAQQQPGAGGRERLLVEAAVPMPVPQHPERSFSVAALFRLDARPGFGSTWALGPFTQTRSWSFHQATSLRMIA